MPVTKVVPSVLISIYSKLNHVQFFFSSASSRRVPNTDVCSYLLQPMQKQQLVTLGVDNVYPFMSPSEAQLNEYLENTPAGIDFVCFFFVFFAKYLFFYDVL